MTGHGNGTGHLAGAHLIASTAPTTEPVTAPAAQLVMNAQTLTGSAHDTEEAMRFAVTTGVRPMVERMPLGQAQEAVARISVGAPRFRIIGHTAALR